MSFLLEHLTGGKKIDESIKPKEFERYSEILPSSQFIPKKGDYWEDVSPTTKWRNLPEMLGGGQYSYDPERSQALVKSIRQFTPDLNKEMRQGLPSRFFQIDHIIPLWAGGSDNVENKQTLTLGLHDQKTKVGAVARTLYYNKEVSLSDAKNILINWKNRNIDGIEIDDNGELSSDAKEALVIAQHKKHEWDNPKAPKVSVGDVVEEMKRGWAGQLMGGVVSGFTGHWVEPYKFEEEEKTTGEQVSRFVGELGGMLAGLKGLQSVLTRGAKAVGLGNLASSWGKSRWLSGSDASIRAGKVAVPRRIGMKVIQNAGLFTIHGQLSKQETNDVEGRAKRFLSDAAFGSLVSIPGNSLKGYAGLAGGVYALSAIEGATPKESLFNSALMVGFHTLGHKSRSQAINDLAIKESLKFRTKYGIGTLEKVEQDIVSGRYREKKYTVDEINTQNEKAFKSLREELKINENLTPEHIKAEVDKIIITGRQLYKEGLGVEKRLTEDIIDMRTTVRRENAIKKFENVGVPEPIYNALTKDAEKILNFGKEKLSISQAKFIKDNKANIIDGRIKVVGTVKGMDGEDIIKAYEKGLRAGDNVIAVTRPDMKDFVLAKNIDKSLLQKTPNPENNIQVLALIDKDVYRLGMLPSEAKISTMLFNINEAMRRFGIKEFDPKFNKDTISEAMKKSKIDYIVGKIEHITPKAKVGEQPSVTIAITQESYTASRGLTKAETIKKDIELKTKRASERIIGSTLTREGRTFFTPIVQDIEKALLKKNPIEAKKYFKENLGIKLTDDEIKSLLKKEAITLKEIFNVLKKMKEGGRMDEKGKNLYELLLGKQGFYDKLSQKDKNFIDSLKLLGEKVPEKMPKEAEKVTKISEKVPEMIEKPIVVKKPVIKETIQEEKKVTSDIPKEEIEKRDISIIDKGEKTPNKEAEIVTAEKKETPDDWMNYEYGIHKGAIKPFDNVINKLRNNGFDSRADEIVKVKNLLTRDNLKTSATDLMVKFKNNNVKAFKEFQERYANLFKKIKEKNPFENYKNSQALKHHFLRLTELKPYKKVFLKDGKAHFSQERGTYKNSQEVGSFADDRIIKYKETNPEIKDIDIVHIDVGNSKFSSKKTSEQAEEIMKLLEKEGYCVCGISGNNLKNIIAIKKNDHLIKKFNKDYLADGESLERISETDKMLKVYSQDVIGFSKNEPMDSINKRLPLVHSHELINPVQDIKYTVNVFDSPKLESVKESTIGKFMKDSPKEDIQRAYQEFSIMDGSIFITEKAADKILKAGGFIGERSRLKPTMAYNHDGNLILQKGNINIIKDGVFKKFAENLLGRPVKENDVVTFYDNIKIGEKLFKDNNNVLEIPSEAFRFEYSKPHKNKASLSFSVLGQFSNSDKINKDLINLFKPEVNKFIDFVNKLNNARGGSDIKKTFKEYPEYGIDIDKSMWDKMLLKVNNEAGINLANKQIHDVVNQIFKKRVLDGSFLKGDHLYLAPDIGVKNGKNLSPGEAMISRKKWEILGKPEHILTMRYPVSHKMALSKDRVIISEDYGIKSLGNESVILNHRDVAISKQGDFDGDSVHIFAVGKDVNKIPESIANNVEKTRNKMGDIILGEAEKFDKVPFSYNNTKDMIRKVVLGYEGINMTASTKRGMETIVDAKLVFKTKINKSGFKVINVSWKDSKQPYREFTTKHKPGKEFIPEEFTIKFGEREIKETAQLLQDSVDATSTKNLSKKMGKDFDITYLWKKYLNTEDRDISEAASKVLSSFQLPFRLDAKDVKNNLDLFNKIKSSNKVTDYVVKNGGKTGPVQSIIKLFNIPEFSPLRLTTKNKNVQFNYDQIGRDSVIKKYADRFDIGNVFSGKSDFILDVKANNNIDQLKVKKIIAEVKRLNREHSKNYKSAVDKKGVELTTEEIYNVKKELRDNFMEFWNVNKTKLNQDEKDAISYYLTTAYDANISLSRNFFDKNLKDKSMFVYRLENVFNEASSSVAKTYNFAAESYHPEKIASLKKYLGEKKIKIGEKAAQKIVESPIKGKQWLVDYLKKHPTEKYKNIIPKK